MRLTHVRLLVRDFPVMVAFYRDTLGLKIGFNDGENFAEVDAGAGLQISIFVGHGMGDAVAGGVSAGEGDRAVVIFNVDDVDAMYRKLTSHGLRFVTPPKDSWRP